MNVTILTDASCSHLTGVGGYGFWIVSDRGSLAGGNHFKALLRDINTGEAQAIVNALLIALKKKLALTGDTVLIQTDSTTAISRLTRHPNTFNNRRTDLNVCFVEFWDAIKDYKLDIRFKHVKAHTPNQDKRSKANRLCDERAYYHMKKADKHFKTYGELP